MTAGASPLSVTGHGAKGLPIMDGRPATTWILPRRPGGPRLQRWAAGHGHGPGHGLRVLVDVVDCRDRVADRAVLAALGWTAGIRLEIREAGGLLWSGPTGTACSR
jgi:hypothetical protein